MKAKRPSWAVVVILLVQEFPGFGAIKPPDPSGLNNGGIEVAKIDAHSVRGPISWFPVGNAAAIGTPNKPEAFISPDVTSQIAFARKNFHLAWIVIAPEPSVAATDGAVATREPPRLGSHLDPYGTTVTRTCEHGTVPLVRPNDRVARAIAHRPAHKLQTRARCDHADSRSAPTRC